jgi:hypothetical protein
MSFNITWSLEPVAVLLLFANLVVWPLHFFLRRQIDNLNRIK